MVPAGPEAGVIITLLSAKAAAGSAAAPTAHRPDGGEDSELEVPASAVGHGSFPNPPQILEAVHD